MFEIGSSLREARLRRGLELDAVQKALRLRRRYLEALESDRFDLLPGEAYARGFLREYAEFLGLDGSLYVEEYNARFAHRDEPPIVVPRTVRGVAPRSRRRVLGTAALAVVAVGGGVAAWQAGGRQSNGVQGLGTSAAAVAAGADTTTRQRTAPAAKPAAPAARPPARTLTLAATRGDCWIGVRVGSATGKTIYWQTLRQGQTIRFGLRRQLWIRVGAGQNVDARVGTRILSLPTLTGDVVVPAVS